MCMTKPKTKPADCDTILLLPKLVNSHFYITSRPIFAATNLHVWIDHKQMKIYNTIVKVKKHQYTM